MIRFHTTATAYSDTRFAHIKKVEGTIAWAYNDSVFVPTIGIGFNLRDSFVLAKVLAAFKLNPANSLLTTTEQRDREQYYVNRITQTALMSWASTDAVRAALNEMMRFRLLNTG